MIGFGLSFLISGTWLRGAVFIPVRRRDDLERRIVQISEPNNGTGAERDFDNKDVHLKQTKRKVLVIDRRGVVVGGGGGGVIQSQTDVGRRSSRKEPPTR